MGDLLGVKGPLKSVERGLKDQLERRERLLKESRDVIGSCSRGIIAVHNRRMTDAIREIEHARNLLASLKRAGSGPVSRYLISPEAEFVEASAVYALARGRKIPSRAELGASSEAYLLGLLDTVGELKRLVLDSMLRGDGRKARVYFLSMEELYGVCSPFAAYDHVVNGARRKIDVARMLVEDTRGLLAEAAGREELSQSLKRVAGKLPR